MKDISILSDTNSFSREFHECCKKYSKLDFYVAWIGNPEKVLPFEFLNKVNKINATVGIHFFQTHPKGIKFLMDIKSNVRVVRSNSNLFHPKVYIFSNEKHYSVFIGSSNFTYCGYYENYELNTLIKTDDFNFVKDLKNDLIKFRSDSYPFTPKPNWLKKYSIDYLKAYKKKQKHKIESEDTAENNASNASWLKVASWETYLQKVNNGFDKFPNVNKELGPEMKSTGEAIRFIKNLRDPYFRQLYKDRSMYLSK